MTINSWQVRSKNAVDGFIWAAQRIPTGRHHVIPLPVFGELSAARRVFHVDWYTANVVKTSLDLWLVPDAQVVHFESKQEELDWRQSDQTLHVILEGFQTATNTLMAQIASLNENQLSEVRETLWGNISLEWMLTHFYQILLENTNILVRMSLYWDMYLEAEAQARWDMREENEAGTQHD